MFKILESHAVNDFSKLNVPHCSSVITTHKQGHIYCHYFCENQSWMDFEKFSTQNLIIKVSILEGPGYSPLFKSFFASVWSDRPRAVSDLWRHKQQHVTLETSNLKIELRQLVLCVKIEVLKAALFR